MASSSALDLTRDLTEVVRGVAPTDVDEILRRGLDWLQRVVRFDLATIFWLEGDELVVRAARGPLFRPDVRRHRLPLERYPSVREVLETRRARAFEAHDHAHGDGDPFDGVLDLPAGHACMVVPLAAGPRVFGALTLDRAECDRYPDATVALVEVYGQVLGLALSNAEKAETLERLHDSESTRARLLEAELEGEGLLGGTASAAMREVYRRAERVAPTTTPVLIRGETGTGKERLAFAIHQMSPRRAQPFVRLNCAAIPAALLEAELFGHVKGAFTGAERDRAGRFQLANGGTLLLDEIGELPMELQAKLLRVLQEGTLEPVGSDRTVKVDVRVLAATHVDLERAIAERAFREDLYYRLDVFPLMLPPLRERLDDLPGLVDTILREQARRTGRGGMRVTPAALVKLAAYPWPGTLRELANLLERATILATSRDITPELLALPDAPRPALAAAGDGWSAPLVDARARPARGAGPGARALGAPRVEDLAPRPPGARWPTLEEVEAEYVRRVLAETEGRIYGAGGAAEILGLKPSTLQSRMKKLGVARRGGAELGGRGPA
jgi:transcriptional regulator with GAF, ATPase, and Fis domain